MEKIFSSYLERTISIRDTAARDSLKENFYHGFLLGILRYKEDWLVLSNRESGQGYSDILIEIYPEKIGIIIELKYAQKSQLDSACQNALTQIIEKDYAAVLRKDGMQTILKYGIACRYKQCRVIVENNTKKHPEIISSGIMLRMHLISGCFYLISYFSNLISNQHLQTFHYLRTITLLSRQLYPHCRQPKHCRLLMHLLRKNQPKMYPHCSLLPQMW